MTMKEAVEVIKTAQSQVEWDYPMDYAAAFDLAIKALEAQDATDTNGGDMISREELCEKLNSINLPVGDETVDKICSVIGNIPSAQPDNRLEKIADLVEGTIDHFDRDDAMDLLYQIKEVFK